MKQLMGCWRIALAVVALTAISPVRRALLAQQHEPPWRTHIMPWQTHTGQPRPWRDDPRLSGRAEPGYPDDFPVLFANADSATGGRHEVMWVTVIAYDRASDLFLGILKNQPNFLHSVQEEDNVVFRFDVAKEFPVAVGIPDYAAAGWPPSASESFNLTLRNGVRAYRTGRNGHNQPGIERCIAILSAAMGNAPTRASREEQFVGHFVLGRCYAEKYETKRAIEQFRAAIAAEPDDYDSHMALLAELSVMTHRKPAELSVAEETRWEREFLEELAVVRRRFAANDGVARTLEMLFDPSLAVQGDTMSKAELAKMRRVGFAVLRWKQR